MRKDLPMIMLVGLLGILMALGAQQLFARRPKVQDVPLRFIDPYGTAIVYDGHLRTAEDGILTYTARWRGHREGAKP